MKNSSNVSCSLVKQQVHASPFTRSEAEYASVLLFHKGCEQFFLSAHYSFEDRE